MNTPENTFISAVHRHIPVGLYRIKNNNTYNAGQADVWYSGMGGDLWVEYKFIQIPARPQTVIDMVGGARPDISHLQQDWIRSRHQEGRNVGVIIGSKAGGVWFPGVAWDRTYTAAEFKEWLTDRAALGQIIGNLTS